jgi:hypothetical protein
MSTPQEIADRSLRLASDFLESARRQIIDMSAGDLGMLKEAADLVQQKSRRGPTLSHSPEHLAFSVITTAHRELIDDPDRLPHR